MSSSLSMWKLQRLFKSLPRALLLCSIHSGSLRLTEQRPWYLYLSCSALGTEPENSLTFLDKVVLLLLMSPRPHLPASSWHSASKCWVYVPLLWLFSNRLKQTSIPVLLHFILRTEILSIDLLSWHEQVLLKELDSRTRPLLLNARTTIFSLASDRSPKDKALGSAGQKVWAWGAKQSSLDLNPGKLNRCSYPQCDVEQIINKRYRGLVYGRIMKQSNYFAYCQTVFPKVAFFLSFLDNTNFGWSPAVFWEVSVRLDSVLLFNRPLHAFIPTHFLRHTSV